MLIHGIAAKCTIDTKDKMNRIFYLFLIALTLFASQAFAITVSFPANCPAENSAIGSFSTQDCLVLGYPTYSLHYYLLNVSNASFSASFNIGNVVSAQAVNTMNVYPISTQTFYNTSGNSSEFDNITTGGESDSVDTTLNKEYLVELKTPPFESGSWNGTVGITTFDPTISACEQIVSPGFYDITNDISGDLGVGGDYSCIEIVVDNVSISGNGHTVTDVGGNSGLLVFNGGYIYNIVVANGTFVGSDGIELYQTRNSKLFNVTLKGSSDFGIQDESTQNVTISNSTIIGSGNFGLASAGTTNNTYANSTMIGASAPAVYLTGTDGALFINNTFIRPGGDLLEILAPSNNNTFYWNNFTNTSGYYVNDADGGNFYNTTLNGHGEGNLWFNVLNGSVNITGTVLSSFSNRFLIGGRGISYPYNSLNSLGKIIGGTDFAPLVPTLYSVQLVPPTPANNLITNNSYVYINATISLSVLDTCILNVNSSQYPMINNGVSCFLNQSYSNGNYMIDVYAYNSANASQNATSANISFSINSSLPVIFVPPTPSSGAYIQGNLTVNATLPDLDSCLLNANNSSNSLSFPFTSNGFYCYDTQNLSDGIWTFSIYGYNSTNVSQNGSSGNRTIIIDNTAPTSLVLYPQNGSAFQSSLSINLSYVELNFAKCTLNVNGNNYSMTPISAGLCQYNLTNFLGNVTAYGTVMDLAGNYNTSANYSYYGYNNLINLITPSNNVVLSGNGVLFSYSISVAPGVLVSCGTYDNNNILDNYSILSTGTRSFVSESPSAGSNIWWVTCTSNTSTINSSAVSFTINAANPSFNNYINISLEPENALADPQALFYDLFGNLNALYYSDIDNTAMLHITTISGSSIIANYSISNPITNDFIVSMRLATNTTVLLFDNATDSVEQFASFDGTNLYLANASSQYTPNSNAIFDPYSYAYTKQYENLSLDSGSYYLFWIPENSESTLVTANATLTAGNTLVISNVTTVATGNLTWQTIADSSDLHNWIYAAPNGGVITIYSYNGSVSIPIAIPDPTSYPTANLTASKVFFESYQNETYFIQLNLTTPMIYRINDGKNVTLNSSIVLPSNFYFVDADTFTFFSNQSGATYAYSCYFGNAAPNASCQQLASSDYGAAVPYNRGTMTTAKRIPNPIIGPVDDVTTGQIVNTNVSTLYYQQYSYDVKLRCFDEENATRDLMNARVFTDSGLSAVMSAGTYVWGYVLPSQILGPGQRTVYSLCQDSANNNTLGASRTYFAGPLPNLTLDTYSLVVPDGQYYVFTVDNCYSQPIQGAIISAYRYIVPNNAWTLVEQAKTQIAGDGTLFLQPQTPYQINVVALSGPSQGVNLNFDFTPASTTSLSATLQCAGANITPSPTYENIYGDLSYFISPINGYTTNQSFNITFQAQSANGLLVSTNFVVYRTPLTGNNEPPVLIYNQTSTQPSGTYIQIPVAASTGAAQYDMVATMMETLPGFYNESNTSIKTSFQVVPVIAQSKAILQNFNSLVQQASDIFAGARAFGGWAWIFIATVITMLTMGYVSRYSIDGAGIIGVAIFWGFALIYNASICLFGPCGAPGTVFVSMMVIAMASTILALLVMAWRYA